MSRGSCDVPNHDVVLATVEWDLNAAKWSSKSVYDSDLTWFKRFYMPKFVISNEISVGYGIVRDFKKEPSLPVHVSCM